MIVASPTVSGKHRSVVQLFDSSGIVYSVSNWNDVEKSRNHEITLNGPGSGPASIRREIMSSVQKTVTLTKKLKPGHTSHSWKKTAGNQSMDSPAKDRCSAMSSQQAPGSWAKPLRSSSRSNKEVPTRSAHVTGTSPQQLHPGCSFPRPIRCSPPRPRTIRRRCACTG